MPATCSPVAAINVNGAAGDEPRQIAGEEQRSGSRVLGGTEVTERRHERGEELWFACQHREARFLFAGARLVDADATGAEFERQ
jgi:hypothetical protein